MNKQSITLVLLLLVCACVADLPVHCEFPEVKGYWLFNLTEPKYDKNNIFASCDYFSDIDATHSVTLSLQGPDLAIDLASGTIGHWTLLQDQGFEVNIFGKQYLAFFRYTTMPNKTVVSECYRTLTGWYHANQVNVKKEWGCFQAFKVKGENEELPKPVAYPLSNTRQEFFSNDEEMVRQINTHQISWTATTYDFLEGRPMNELVSPFSLSIPKEKRFVSASKPQIAMDLPTEWDWRNASGVNYVPPVRDQGKCGSCFSFAGTGMLASRVRIATLNQKQPVFAPQDVVSCSKYSQGCHGGDAYLVGKYAQDFGVIPEECDPYIGQDSQCIHKCPFDDQRQFVSHYTYVGGYYGNTNADNMMEAIATRGPVTIGFYVYRDFMYYKSGVYHHVPTATGNSPDPHYEATGHAVLVVGYGVTNEGEKYWICQNSWSEKWGMNGYFLIRRGVDESNCESKAVEATMFF